MVARSAYAQLRCSPLLLAGTVAGMTLTYIAPVLLALFARGPAQILGLLTWGAMAIAFQPTLRIYRVYPLWGCCCRRRAFLHGFYHRFRLSEPCRTRRTLERPCPSKEDRLQ